jgi:GH15 family glucan-1,4-alpha-glucosidase
MFTDGVSIHPRPRPINNSPGTNGRVERARALFERVVALSNDLGLLAEEWDVSRERQVGNFPQAFSHLTLISAAKAISAGQDRRDRQ